MPFDVDRATSFLRLGSGRPDATFREGQIEAIRHVVEGRGRLLVVQKTGWGKSFVYFIATKLLREAGLGPAILVSPLLALMRNQVAAAERMGVRAVTINSENKDDWDSYRDAILQGRADIVLISPERLANDEFVQEVLGPVSASVSLLVVDEAHCISDWGHDFRPDYRLVDRLARNLPANLRVLATTATANNRVMDDLRNVLGPELVISRGDMNRPNLALQSIRLPEQAQRLAWLADHVPQLPGSGIIYALTVKDANQVSNWLQSCGVNAPVYTGGDDPERRRPQLEQALLDNQVKALVATSALGMGFDKPDLSFVIHYQMPGSVVAYYQQVGRAGRALPAARGVLLCGQEDKDVNSWFINSAFPPREVVDQVLETLEKAPGGLSVNELQARVNTSWGRITQTLKLLSLESPAPVVKRGSKWQVTAAPLSLEFWARAERLTSLRQVELHQM
ncbi:MAG TPA: RecQ family ATP-dependent DNA helicase, partial [Deinococcales bacterium]|nr:RecQ family ATP-dependent DNA helicase [Deinococcales bacterium]